jgi:hypothetical protein
VDRHPQRSAHRSLEQGARHLRPVAQPKAKRRVELRERDARQHVPRDAVTDEAFIAGRRPRLQHVALAKQLGRDVSGEHQVARDKTIENQEPQVARATLAGQPADAGCERPERRHQSLACA